MWRRSSIVIALLSFGASLARAQPEPVSVGAPIPSWVEPAAVVAPSHPAGDGDGVERWLTDEQVTLHARGWSSYRHVVIRIADAQGLAGATTLEVDVGVSETLRWHFVRIRRDGRTLPVLEDVSQLRVIQPEEGLQQGLIDESRRAVLVVDDLRVGDVLEWAFTLHRDEPALDGRVSATLHPALHARPGSLGRYRLDVRWPPERRLSVRRVHVPESWVTREELGHLRIDVDSPSVPPPAPVDAPPEHDPTPRLEISELPSWAAVVEWALPLYEAYDDSPFPAAVPLRDIEAGATLEERVGRALRFVQDDVRYLGIESGAGALVPRDPALVARRRYGDCKDKSLLLVVILRRLGVTARAALVHASQGAALPDRLPGPHVFDHVIVRAELDGRTLWLEPTRTGDRGPVSALPPPPYVWALPIGPGVEALEPIAPPALDTPTAEVTERFDVRRPVASLVVETLYRGDDARTIRNTIERLGVNAAQEGALSYYRSVGLAAEVTAPLEVVDDGDVVRLTERYRVPDFWGGGTRDVSPWLVLQALPIVDDERAAVPLEVRHPLHVLHRVIVRSSLSWVQPTRRRTFGAGPLRITHEQVVDGNELTVTTRLRSEGGRVAAADVDDFRAALRSARSEIGYAVVEFADSEVRTEDGDWTGGYVCCGVIGFGVLLVVLVRTRRRLRATWRRRAFRRAQRAEAGESPSTAVEVQSAEAARDRVRVGECCGQTRTLSWSSARLGADALEVARLDCESCGDVVRRYFKIDGD